MSQGGRASVSQTSPATSKIIVSDGILVLQSNIQRADYISFENGCKELQHSGFHKILLDLTRCTYVSSLFIGILVDAVTQMKAEGKEVLVHVSPEVGKFLHMAHLYHLFDYKILDSRLNETPSRT